MKLLDCIVVKMYSQKRRKYIYIYILIIRHVTMKDEHVVIVV